MRIKTDKEQEDNLNSDKCTFICGNCENWNNGKKPNNFKLADLSENHYCKDRKEKTNILDFCDVFIKRIKF